MAKKIVAIVGTRVIQSLHFDCLAETPASPLSDKSRHRARQAAHDLPLRRASVAPRRRGHHLRRTQKNVTIGPPFGTMPAY